MEFKVKEAIKKLLDISDVSYYRWKKERPIFDLLEAYFTKDELNEFLETGKIEKFEAIKNKTKEEICQGGLICIFIKNCKM